MNIEIIPLPTAHNFIDLTGQVFGRLTVAAYAGKRGKSTTWHCKCVCGMPTIVQSGHLKSGHTQSCGCLHREAIVEANTTHGMRQTPLYGVWTTMMQRCYNKKTKKYPIYGGRGITVCKYWWEFANFAASMAATYEPGLQIERYANDYGYAPLNCRWATPLEQARNRRTNHTLTLNGNTRCIAEWTEITGINANTIRKRKQLGWSDEKTLTTPVKQGHSTKE